MTRVSRVAPRRVYVLIALGVIAMLMLADMLLILAVP